MVVLARVDQRLIHGLIVNQWAPHLQVKRFMVVDDVLCNNEEIKASMRMAKPAGTGVSVIRTESVRSCKRAGDTDPSDGRRRRDPESRSWNYFQ